MSTLKHSKIPQYSATMITQNGLKENKTQAKRKSDQGNDLYGKAMILFELQLTEQLNQKLKQYNIKHIS